MRQEAKVAQRTIEWGGRGEQMGMGDGGWGGEGGGVRRLGESYQKGLDGEVRFNIYIANTTSTCLSTIMFRLLIFFLSKYTFHFVLIKSDLQKIVKTIKMGKATTRETNQPILRWLKVV